MPSGRSKRSLAALLVTLASTSLFVGAASAQNDAELLPCGVPATRALDSGATHEYLVTIPPGETAVIDSGAISGNIGLIRVIAENANGELDSCSGSLVVPGSTGITRLTVSDCIQKDGESGEYTVSASIVSQSPSQCGRRLPCGIVPGGVEHAGAVLPYTFTANAGERLNLLVTKFGSSDRAARLRLFAPTGDLIVDSPPCTGSVRATLPTTGVYTVLVSSCVAPAVGRFTMLREGDSCPQGPVITYFGLSRSDDIALQPDTFDADGRPVYIRPLGSGFSLIVEAHPGPTGRQPGQLAFDYDANDPTVLPDLQILLSRPIGFGTPAVCDTLPPQQAGVPPASGFSFDGSEEVSRVVNDLGCRFNNGAGLPLGRVQRGDACTRTPITLDFDFVDPGSTIQFCGPIARAWAFAPGDTIVKARVRDNADVYGSEREIVVRAEGDSPFFLSDVTAGELIGADDAVYFSAQDAAHGIEVWKTDGTRDGTGLARDVIPGPGSSSPRNLVVLDDKPFFLADVSPDTTWVWPVNGLPVDSTSVSPSVFPPYALTPVGGLLFFFAENNTGGLDLWTSDGNSENAEAVSELSSQPLAVDSVVASDGIFFFTLRHDTGTSTIAELWRSDGTTDGTRPVHRFSYAADAEGRLEGLTDVAGSLFFVAGDRRFGYGLWHSDGTSDGTEQLRSFATPPAELTAADAMLFFVATDGAHGTELWTSDGTQAGTQLVADINPGPGSAAVHQLTAINGRLFFAANDGTHGSELWTSTGTASRTALVKDIAPGAGSSNPTALRGINGALYLSADDGQHGSELWISDGTETGTVLALDVDPGNSSGNPDAFTLRRESASGHGAIVFRALYGPAGPKLWAVPALESIINPFVCPGDCDGNDLVTVNELVTGVGTSLGSSTTASCTAMDRNGDGRVTVDELVAAVNAALRGCDWKAMVNGE